jgi:hypothetical protein
VQKKRPHVVAEKLIASDSTWVEVFHPEFDGIYWSYEDRRSIDAYSKQAYLACNGIFVTSGFYGRETPNISIADKGSPAQIAMPCLLVDDKNGRFPLNIQRNGIVDKRFPFQRELAASIADVFARELYLSLNMAPVPSNIPEALRQADRVFSKFSKYRRAQILGLSSCGWIPLDAAVMSGKLPSVVIFDVSQGEYDGYLCGLEFSENSALLIPFLLDGQGYGAVVAAFRVILEGSNQWNYSSPIERFQKFVLGMRVFVRQDIDNAFRKRGGLPQYLLRGMVLRSTIDGWFVYEVGSPGDVSDEDISNAVGEMEITKSRCVVFCYFDPAVNAELIETAEPFAPAWLETVPNGYLAREPTA